MDDYVPDRNNNDRRKKPRSDEMNNQVHFGAYDIRFPHQRPTTSERDTHYSSYDVRSKAQPSTSTNLSTTEFYTTVNSDVAKSKSTARVESSTSTKKPSSQAKKRPDSPVRNSVVYNRRDAATEIKHESDKVFMRLTEEEIAIFGKGLGLELVVHNDCIVTVVLRDEIDGLRLRTNLDWFTAGF